MSETQPDPHVNPETELIDPPTGLGADPGSDATGLLPNRPVRVPHPPFPAGTRFEDPAFLGQGGMGTVYSAFDPVLKRRVAIKVLFSENPESRARFTFEARALARVDHPHVIKLLEVGEVGDIPFLVMPLLEGDTLLGACAALSLPAKIEVIRRVADGVHAAHLKGLLHRDLKPANIMVVGTHPYVMDFGLAIPAEGSDLTQMGMVLGTAAYMSPEQASGAKAAVDVRSDVYGLGVTLYQLLGGALPYSGTSQLDLLRLVLEGKPMPLGLLRPGLPRDLTVIVHQCLARDPEKRYQSARALSEDLGRFLEGRPIHARPPSLAYRLGKWYVRQRVAALTATASLAILLALGGWMGWVLHRTRLQVAYREHFGTAGQQIANQLQLAWLAPAHDIRGHVVWARTRMQELLDEQARLGPLALPPAQNALGRIQLVLDDPLAARQAFQKAWDLGLRTPETADLLAQAETQLYIAARDKVRAQGESPSGSADLARLDATLKGPALALLGSKGKGGGAAYEAGITAYLNNDMPLAIRQLNQALAQEPWNHKAHWYLAWCWQAQARVAEGRGDLAEARADLDQADQALQAASGVARSNKGYYHDLVLLRMAREAFETGHGGDPGPWRARALQACDLALAVDPGYALIYGWRSEINDRAAMTATLANRPAQAYRQAALDNAQRAVAMDPGSAFCQVTLAKEYMRRVDDDQKEGRDAAPSLALAETAASAALRINAEDRDALTMAVFIHFLQGEQRRIQGLDPRPDFGQALVAARRTCAAAGDDVGTWAMVVALDNSVAEAALALGESPEACFPEAEAAALQARKALPDFFSFLCDEARNQRLQAAWAVVQGRDPGPFLAGAEAFVTHALKANPRSDEAWGERGAAALLAARVDLLRHASPLAHLREARDAFRQAGTLKPAASEPWQGLARVALVAWAVADPAVAALRQEGAQALAQLQAHHGAEPLTLALRGALASRGPRPQDGRARVDQALQGHELLAREFRPFGSVRSRAEIN